MNLNILATIIDVSFFTRILAVLILLTISSGPVSSGSAPAGSRWLASFEESLPLAQEGDPEHQYRIGYIYGTGGFENQHGEQIEKDLDLSISWVLRAAKQSHTDAMFTLARAYDDAPNPGWSNLGLSVDAAESFFWWSKLAEAELPQAYHKLGLFYKDGRGIEQDKEEARKWFRLAAVELGSPQSAVELGQDPYSYGLILNAARDGSLEDQKILAMMHFWAEGHLNNEEEAFYWYRAAANQGDTDSMFSLGLYLGSGNHLGERSEGIEWMKKAALHGHLERGVGFAADILGYTYMQGVDVEKSIPDAIKWFYLGYVQGSLEAEHNLSDLLEKASAEHQRSYETLID